MENNSSIFKGIFTMYDAAIIKATKAGVGDSVSWGSSGGTAKGKILRVVRNGKINVPGSSFTITGTPEDPAVLIRLLS